jgi:hypothetical protein
LVEPENATDPTALKKLVSDFGLRDGDGVRHLDQEDIASIANLLKKVPRKQFFEAFQQQQTPKK